MNIYVPITLDPRTKKRSDSELRQEHFLQTIDVISHVPLPSSAKGGRPREDVMSYTAILKTSRTFTARRYIDFGEQGTGRSGFRL